MDEIKSEDLWNVHSNVSDLIKFADTKASTLLTGIGIITALIISNIEQIGILIQANPLLLVIALLAGVSGLCCLSYSIMCLIPILKSSHSNSLIFFGDIARNFPTVEKYQVALNARKDKEHFIENQLVHQIWINSKIASRKYFNIKWAIRFFFTTIALSIMGIIFSWCI